MLDKFHERLREAGKSVTKARTQLFLYLQRSGPVTVAQLMRDNTMMADRASLYRTLLAFRELGVIEDRIIRGRRMVELTDRYDAHHHHLTCEGCGASITIMSPEIEQALVAVYRQHGFAATNHSIEASGLCRGCRELQQG
jgi:Fur family ferric uptake transcriptional regulator